MSSRGTKVSCEAYYTQLFYAVHSQPYYTIKIAWAAEVLKPSTHPGKLADQHFALYASCGLVSEKAFRAEWVILQQFATCTSPIMHLICPPQILHNLCFSFLLGITAVPRERENNAYAKFWVANMVHYGRCANGEFNFFFYQTNNTHMFKLLDEVVINWNRILLDLPHHLHSCSNKGTVHVKQSNISWMYHV